MKVIRKSIRVLTYIIYPFDRLLVVAEPLTIFFVYGEMDRYGSVCLGRIMY